MRVFFVCLVGLALSGCAQMGGWTPPFGGTSPTIANAASKAESSAASQDVAETVAEHVVKRVLEETSLRAGQVNLPNVIGNEVQLREDKKSGLHYLDIVLNERYRIEITLDSGASVTSISPDIVDFLYQAGAITFDDFVKGEKMPIRLADGSVNWLGQLWLKQVRIGNVVIPRVRALINPDKKWMMLLGQSVLQRLGKYTVDYDKDMLILDPSEMMVPSLAYYPVTDQAQMQATHHWDVLAKQVAAKIVAQLGGEKVAYFVEPPTGEAPFALAFHELLTTHLVDKGRILFRDERLAKVNGAYTLKYDVQVVDHEGSAGIEILVATRTENEGRVMVADSAIYYLDKAHKGNYTVPTPVPVVKPKLTKVVGG